MRGSTPTHGSRWRRRRSYRNIHAYMSSHMTCMMPVYTHGVIVTYMSSCITYMLPRYVWHRHHIYVISHYMYGRTKRIKRKARSSSIVCQPRRLRPRWSTVATPASTATTLTAIFTCHHSSFPKARVGSPRRRSSSSCRRTGCLTQEVQPRRRLSRSSLSGSYMLKMRMATTRHATCGLSKRERWLDSTKRCKTISISAPRCIHGCIYVIVHRMYASTTHMAWFRHICHTPYHV